MLGPPTAKYTVAMLTELYRRRQGIVGRGQPDLRDGSLIRLVCAGARFGHLAAFCELIKMSVVICFAVLVAAMAWQPESASMGKTW